MSDQPSNRKAFEGLLMNVRGPYMSALFQAYTRMKARAEAGLVRGFCEMSMWVDADTEAERDPMQRVLYDLAEIHPDGTVHPIEVLTREHVQLPPTLYRVRPTLAIEVETFMWSSCVLVVRDEADKAAAVAHAWYVRWFDRETGGHPYRGIVHFMESERDGDQTAIHLDLGSAPEVAMLELVDELASAGVREGLLFAPPGDLERARGNAA